MKYIYKLDQMLKKFLLAFLAILGYMGMWAAILYAAIILSGDPIIIISLAAACFVLYFPFFIVMPTFIFRFKSQEPNAISEQELRKKLLDINNLDVPVTVSEKGKKIIITWKYLDAKWWELLQKRGATSIYQLIIKLNGEKKRAKLIDVNKKVSWGVSPTKARIRGGYFRGIMLQYEIGKAWGVRENFMPGKIYDYKFTPSEIKNPIMNEILKSGWDVRFGMY